jgi:HK97 gp10 family phage protein
VRGGEVSIEFDESLKKVLAEMDKLPLKIEANLVRGGLRAAAKPMFEAARDRVPVGTGQLRDSIRLSSAIKKRAGEIYVKISVGSRVSGGASRKKGEQGAFYAHMVEWGTAKHEMNGSFSIGGHIVKKIKHPGAKARPFMRPAFDTADYLVVEMYAAYMTKNIDKALSKHGIS